MVGKARQERTSVIDASRVETNDVEVLLAYVSTCGIYAWASVKA